MFTQDINTTLVEVLRPYPVSQIFVVAPPRFQSMLSYPVCVIEDGEENKSLQSIQTIWDFLFEHNATRQSVLVCLGGGLITDLGGFAASTYKRGMNFVHIPTTILSMVDAATGGKTGCNYHGLKNSIGTFAKPIETIICPPMLQSLPAEEWLSGYAEMLKHALLAGPEEWDNLLQYDLDKRNIDDLTPLLESSLAFKQHVIDIDPTEHSIRKVLNLGHTIGHALEELNLTTQTKQPVLKHGYAVLYGLVAELYLSVVQLDCPREPLQQLSHLMLEYYGRPNCNCKDRDRLLTLMRQDKKNTLDSGEVHMSFTLLRRLGEPLIDQYVPDNLILEALDYLFSL